MEKIQTEILYCPECDHETFFYLFFGTYSIDGIKLKNSNWLVCPLCNAEFLNSTMTQRVSEEYEKQTKDLTLEDFDTKFKDVIKNLYENLYQDKVDKIIGMLFAEAELVEESALLSGSKKKVMLKALKDVAKIIVKADPKYTGNY